MTLTLAGLTVPDRDVLELAELLRDSDLEKTAGRLEKAIAREATALGITAADRERILRALDECPESLTELRSEFLRDHEWRVAHGM